MATRKTTVQEQDEQQSQLNIKAPDASYEEAYGGYTEQDRSVEAASSAATTGEPVVTTGVNSLTIAPSKKQLPVPRDTKLVSREEFHSRQVVYQVIENGRRVQKVLTAEIEQELIRICKDNNVPQRQRGEAMMQLLTAYDNYIRALINKNYRYSNVDKEDLQQAAREGFIEAVTNYDDSKNNGGRIITYAFHHIKKNIAKLINQLSYATKTITTKDSSLAKTKIQEIKSQRPLTTQDYENIARQLNNKTAEYVRHLEGAITKATPFDRDTSDPDDSNSAPSDYYVDEQSDFSTELEEQEHRDRIRARFFEAFKSVLDEREQIIVRHRVGAEIFEEEKMKLEQLAAQFEISKERVRQIEESAKRKLSAAMIDFDPTA